MLVVPEYNQTAFTEEWISTDFSVHMLLSEKSRLVKGFIIVKETFNHQDSERPKEESYLWIMINIQYKSAYTI